MVASGEAGGPASCWDAVQCQLLLAATRTEEARHNLEFGIVLYVHSW